MFIERAYKCLNKTNENLCGDRILVSETPAAFLAVLSDGLGSGVKANILATITTKVAMTMLEKGASLDEVVNTLGRTLPVCKVRQLAYSTFTIIQINHDGQVYIAEFDNPATRYIQAGNLISLTTKSRSIGSFLVKETSFKANVNDMLVAVSDGVIHAGIGKRLDFGWTEEKLGHYLKKLAKMELNANQVCDKVLNVACELSEGRLNDDASILALRLRTKKTCTVAVGSPEHVIDDPVFAKKLMQENQKRVICGGTTAQLVAREIGEQLDVEMDRINPNDPVPPTGKIAGIDLVTEGLLTLSKTVKYLQQKEVPEFSNGASRLSNLLKRCDKIHLLVGRAINPAHQNPDLPLELSIKPQLVNELADVLRALGKQVSVEYF